MAIGSRNAQVGITINPGVLERGLRRARQSLGSFGRDARKLLGKGLKAAGKGLGRAFDPLGRGYDLISSQVDDVMAFEKGIARLAISQGKSTESMAAFRSELTAVSKETGLGRNELLSGVQAYQALTGDTKGATDAVRTFGRVAQATGSAVEEIATTGAALAQGLNIPTGQLEEAFGILNTQGKAGAVELKDMAAEMSSLVPQFKQFAGADGVGGMREMGAVLQVVRRGFGTASEASTGMRAAMTAIVRGAPKLKRLGKIDVFTKDKNGNKKLKEFSEIIGLIGNSRLMKDPKKLLDALGSDEALRAVLTLTRNMKDLKSLTALDGSGSIQKDFEQYKNSPAGKMETSMNNLKLAIAEAFDPEIIRNFADGLGAVSGIVGGLVGGMRTLGRELGRMIGGTPWEEEVGKIRAGRLDERMKQVGIGTDGNALIGFGDRASQEKKALKAIGEEDAAEKFFKDVASGKRELPRSEVVQMYRGMAGKTDQTNAFASEMQKVMMMSMQRTFDEAPITAASNARSAKRAVSTIGSVARTGGANADALVSTGFGPADLAELRDRAGGSLDPKAFAQAMANVMAAQMRQMQFILKVDGNTVAKASGDANTHRRH
jgi:TP901 family phage tail tape measure protein